MTPQHMEISEREFFLQRSLGTWANFMAMCFDTFIHQSLPRKNRDNFVIMWKSDFDELINAKENKNG